VRLTDDDRASLRAAVREELAAQHAAEQRSDARPASTDNDPAPRALTDTQIKAFDVARTQVDQGIASRRWTMEDRAQLRANLATLPNETRFELLSPLIVAVNEGRVRFDGRGPLF
jgi:hypothetical protein